MRLSPYAYVDVDCDMVLSKDQVKDGLSDNHKYQWGFYDGSGEPIELTIEEYFDQFVYDYDFMKTESVKINRFSRFVRCLVRLWITYRYGAGYAG